MYSTVLVTVPDLPTACSLTNSVLESRLAACANVFPIRSAYWWKGRIENAEEFAILFKSRTEDFAELEKRIANEHPYDVPCIVRYDIAEGHAPYLEWIRESTARPPEG